ncbi:LysR family transcriptional regulator [Tabrizicola sp. J26]|uniref:LysR family transcriptional regulator n=1 Tax=Alitabrizicola rongguiensis TaxID=2909234 RepID=UPI001F29FD45|nr:LysR family transcriptional regulator [Tabrizicola rongguiensis]MCF1707500.1 LysR family transcriptional regulator [Tabrizicola rongguiensis]
MSFDNWDEIRTAYQVARLGTVSGAAEVLGVHHATVIRHIDALEKRLGTKLFQRHARGYTPTEAGRDLQTVAQATDDQFAQLSGRLRGRGDTVTGELVVTSIGGLSPVLTPVFVSFQKLHPAVRIRFLVDSRLFRLEYGEAHVAIRAGAMPEEPDNVVQQLSRIHTGLYASKSYAAENGIPSSPADFRGHRFIGVNTPASRAPFHRWLAERVAPEDFTFVASDQAALMEAIREGAGIGFISAAEAEGDDRLIEVMPPLPEWEVTLWLVTHVDLHRTTKVQAFVSHLKEAARHWKGL